MNTIAKLWFRAVLAHVRADRPSKGELAQFAACYAAAVSAAFAYTCVVGWLGS